MSESKRIRTGSWSAACSGAAQEPRSSRIGRYRMCDLVYVAGLNAYNTSMKHLAWVLLLLLSQDKGEIRLLVRADDMGVALGVNEACIKSVKDGIARSVEVIVPGPWFLDAVRRLQENPDIDVGIHLCLTSEWDRCLLYT